jgi:lambda repressor-like predicted transcriptional regulator
MPTTIQKPRGRLNDIYGHLTKMSADIFGHLRTSSDVCDNPPANAHLHKSGLSVSVELLAAAMTDAGIDVDTLAERIQVDVRTVRRWVKGTIPYARHQNRIARALNTTARELWPEAHPDPDDARDEQADAAATGRGATGRSGSGEVVAVYAGSDDPELPEWRDLLAGAQSRVLMLDLTLQDVIDPATVTQLAEKAAAGCEVEILISDPDSAYLTTTMLDHDPQRSLDDVPDLTWRLERTIGELQPLLGQPHVEVRMFIAERGVSILRFDDEMLITLHLHGAPREMEPILHLRRDEPGGIFDRYAHHAQLIATHAGAPLAPDPDAYPPVDEHPDRYLPGFQALPGTAFGPVFEVSEAPSPAPTPRWRRRRSPPPP